MIMTPDNKPLSYLQGIPEPASTSPRDFSLGFSDLEHDPSAPDYADTQYQLEDNFFRWTQQFCVEGPMRNYLRYLISSQVLTLELTQSRQSRGSVLISIELDKYRVVAFDPKKHEPQVPTISTSEADLLLDKANAYRSLSTYQHDKRTKPYYSDLHERLTERELKLLALLQLTPQSLSSQILAEELQAEITKLQSTINSAGAPSSQFSEDGIEF